jgi:hypothetical protein
LSCSAELKVQPTLKVSHDQWKDAEQRDALDDRQSLNVGVSLLASEVVAAARNECDECREPSSCSNDAADAEDDADAHDADHVHFSMKVQTATYFCHYCCMLLLLSLLLLLLR